MDSKHYVKDLPQFDAEVFILKPSNCVDAISTNHDVDPTLQPIINLHFGVSSPSSSWPDPLGENKNNQVLHFVEAFRNVEEMDPHLRTQSTHCRVVSHSVIESSTVHLQ